MTDSSGRWRCCRAQQWAAQRGTRPLMKPSPIGPGEPTSDVAARSPTRRSTRWSRCSGRVATRRYIDEQAVWTFMRFAEEPAERLPSRQITRATSGDPRGSLAARKRTFDDELEDLTDPDDLSDRRDVKPLNRPYGDKSGSGPYSNERKMTKKWPIPATSRWARLGLNQRPLACEASALPLSYAPGGGGFYARLRAGPPPHASPSQSHSQRRCRVAARAPDQCSYPFHGRCDRHRRRLRGSRGRR